MAWIEFDLKLRDHWKVDRLSAHLEVDYVTALGHIACLWTWVAEHAPNGDLSKFDVSEIANAARWYGEIPKFLHGIEDCGFVVDNKIHDWDKHGLRLLLSQRNRMKKFRKSLRHRSVNSDVTVTHTLPNHTLPNHTLPKEINKEIKIPEDLLADKNALEDWLAYKREKGKAYKSRGLNALWGMVRSIPQSERKRWIESSMAMNYDGIFPPKGGFNNVAGAFKGHTPTSDYVVTKKPLF